MKIDNYFYHEHSAAIVGNYSLAVFLHEAPLSLVMLGLLRRIDIYFWGGVLCKGQCL